MKKIYNKTYYRKAAKGLGITPAQYMKRSRGMFVVLIDGTVPETWEDTKAPRLFSSFKEAAGWCLATDTVISEYAFIQQFCS